MRGIGILIGILGVALLAGNASACLTPSQIVTLGKIAEQSNVSVDSLVAVFEFLCERDINYTSNLTLLTQADVNATLNQRLAEYDTEIREQLNIIEAVANNTQALGAIAGVINTSQTLEAMNSKVDEAYGEYDARQTRFEDRVDSQIQDLRAEAVGRDEYDNLRANLSSISLSLDQLWMEQYEQPPAGDWTGWAVLAVIIGVLGSMCYLKMRGKQELERAMHSAPRTGESPRVRHVSRQSREEAAGELQQHQEYLRAKRKADEESQREAEALKIRELEEEKKTEARKKREREGPAEDAFKK